MTTHEMKITGTEGDTRISWSPNRADEVENARRTFDNLMAKGYKAFEMGEDGRGDPLDEFNPEISDMILVPPMVGG